MKDNFRAMFILTLFFVLAAMSACSNHVPAIVPIGNKTVKTGTTLEIEVRAVDDDGDPLQFGIEGKPAGATFHDDLGDYALFVWAPIASDAGPEGRGQDYPITFKVTDGIDSTSETIIITVTLGSAGSGAPIFITPSDYTLDLDRTDQIKFNIEVRDADSASIDLRIEDNPTGGSFETAPGSKLASFRWKPSDEQIAEKPVWGIQVSADDHVNPKVMQDISIIIKGGNEKCEGTPPSISHKELSDQRGSEDYEITVTATDAESRVATAALYYLVDLGDGEAGQFSKSTMTNDGGNSWSGAIPNPGLKGDATAKVSYYICAEDDDDPTGTTCDLRACLPEEGRFSFTAYAPGNEQCQNDTQFEPNDSASEATPFEAGRVDNLKICPGDTDWYRVEVPTQYQMASAISFTQANGQLQLDLFAEDGTTLLAAGQQDQDLMIVQSDVVQQQTVMLLRVTGGEGVENSYDLAVVEEEYVPCSSDAYEPNDYPDEAKDVGDGQYPGLTSCGEPDWYKLDLNQGDGLDVSIDFVNAVGDLDLWVFEPSAFNSETLSCDNAVACSTTETDDEAVSIASVALTTTYYIAVGPYQQAHNDYSMTVHVSPAQQDCIDDAGEDNDTPEQASDLWDSGPNEGLKICSNDDDWFQLIGFKDEVLVVDLTFTNSDGDLDMKLYDEGVSVENMNEHMVASAATATDNERIEFTPQVDAIYYLRVYGYDGAENSYSVELHYP